MTTTAGDAVDYAGPSTLSRVPPARTRSAPRATLVP
jgi:hypothetical protein